MLLIADKVNYVSEKVESKFNIAGSIPVFGALSSIARIVAATVQMVAGLVFTATGLCAFGIAQLGEDEEEVDDAKEFIKFGVQYFCHGGLNSIRSCAEIVSQVFSLGIATIIYNCSGEPGEEFEPTVRYTRYHLANFYEYA